jgi:nitrite reductase/ring-hydroxylating ferredoxin subunit
MPDGTRVCAADELAPGEKRRVMVGKRPIALCRSAAGEFFAVSDNCPHQGASMCLGALDGAIVADAPGAYRLERPGEVLRCPWHAWEFDVRTGESLFGERNFRLASYPVDVVDGEVFVGHRARTRAQRAERAVR